jgi:hypothetical protein
MADRLDRIGVEQGAKLFTQRPHLIHVEHGADFVVGVHERHECFGILPGSERVVMRDLQLVADHADGVQLPLLLAVAVADPVRLALEQALAQDFTLDYNKLMAKIDKKLTAVKIGDFQLGGELHDVRHGKVLALGQGLYMPVEARGSARIDYAAPR